MFRKNNRTDNNQKNIKEKNVSESHESTVKLKKRPDFAELARMKSTEFNLTKRKTSNLLEGEARSVYRGRSMDFDELREYSYGDNVRDIDWKSSSRTGKTLVRTYMAQKKNNVLFVCDSGRKMNAETSCKDEKAETAILTFGTLMYLVDQHGDDYGMIMQKDKSFCYEGFMSGMKHYEDMLSTYENGIIGETETSLNKMIEYVTDEIHRQMVVIVITDIDGIMGLTDRVLQKLSVHADAIFLDIDDAYLTDADFDVDSKKYEERIVKHSKKFYTEEVKNREYLLNNASKLMNRYKMHLGTISGEQKMVQEIISVLEKHRGMNYL